MTEGKRKDVWLKDADNIDFSKIDVNTLVFLHPGLHGYIKEKLNSNYKIIKGIVIGDGYEWHKKYSIIMEIERLIEQIPTHNKEVEKLKRDLLEELKEGVIKEETGIWNKFKEKVSASGLADATKFLYEGSRLMELMEALQRLYGGN